MEGGGVQWGGFNEDAADYPIRKFSLHFDRATTSRESNKDDSLSDTAALAALAHTRPREFQRFFKPDDVYVTRRKNMTNIDTNIDTCYNALAKNLPRTKGRLIRRVTPIAVTIAK